mmetsp:Transcript_10073/g.30144  ORF Transcript_10073/g.30144 Transcript_10073/m.30144 type:complete len:84 (-) Transcript_10073:2558-2809(-)
MAERDYKNLQVAVASAYALGLLSGWLLHKYNAGERLQSWADQAAKKGGELRDEAEAKADELKHHADRKASEAKAEADRKTDKL